MHEILTWSAGETGLRIRERAISVTEVVQAHLQRAEQVNPQINALSEILTEEALTAAQAMDCQRPDGELPPLFGVPVTTKINVDQRGCENSNGIPAFAGKPCAEDSAVVKNLRDAGAIVIGRSNTPEFSMRWCTSNPLHGVSLNPWDKTITPGGSSGAAAAAVAMGVGSLAHGNDLGGSLRYPAFCCGVAAIRPSLGRVPAYNPSASIERPPVTQLMSVQGPIARSVEDVRLGLQMMAQQSADDPLWHPAPAGSDSRKGKRDLVVGYCARPFGDDIDPALDAAMQTAIDGLKQAGVQVVEVMPPVAERGAELWGELLLTETKSLMEDSIRQNGSTEMNRVLDIYYQCFRQLDLPGFLEGLNERRRIQRQWAQMFQRVDALLMPTSGIRPFENDLDFKQPEHVPELLKAQRYLCLINLLGLPSVSLPTQLFEGAPVGVQLVGPAGEDDFVLDIAALLEREIGTLVEILWARENA